MSLALPLSARSDAARPRLDIVIVNWNTRQSLRHCLRSIAAARRSGFILDSVVVVDNASVDGSAENIDDFALPLRVINNSENRGFAVACNQGARKGTATFVLFLNPDATLFPETLDQAIGFLSSPDAARVGICGGQMVSDDGTPQESCARFPQLSMFVAKACGLSRLFPMASPRQWMSVDEASDSQPVDHVIGAFFLVRRSIFEQLRGFDERFFLYYEEVDLAYRAKKAGFLSYFLADARVGHTGGVSSAQIPDRRLYCSLRSRTDFARLHWPRRQALALMAFIICVELPCRAAIRLAKGQWSDLRSVATASCWYAKYLINALRSRPDITP